MEDSLGEVFGVGGVALHHRPKPAPRPRSAVVSRRGQQAARPQSATSTAADAARDVRGSSGRARPASAGPRLDRAGSAATQVVAAVPSAFATAGEYRKPAATEAPPSPQWVVERSVSFSELAPEISMVPSSHAGMSVDMVRGLELQESQSAPELALSEEEAATTLSEQSRPGAQMRGRGKRFKVLETVALLAGPSMQSARVGTLQKGEVVTVSEVRGHKLFINHRGWCCRRLLDKVLMVQLGGGVVPVSAPAVRRQQEVIQYVARQRSEQRSETRQVRSMRGSQAHSSVATLQAVVRRQRPSSAPVSGRPDRTTGPSATVSTASDVVNGRSLAGAYPAMGGATVPETGASRPRPRSAGSSRRLHGIATSADNAESSSVQEMRQILQDAPPQIRSGIGAGGLPWQAQRAAAHDAAQIEQDLNVDPSLHLADTTVTFHEHSRPGVSDDVATAWQSLSMPDASVQKWKADQRDGAGAGSDAAAAAAAAAAAGGSDSFMMVRGYESLAARSESLLDAHDHGKVYNGDGGGSIAGLSRPASAPPVSRDKGRPERPSSAPASRGLRHGGRNPNSVGGAGGGQGAFAPACERVGPRSRASCEAGSCRVSHGTRARDRY